MKSVYICIKDYFTFEYTELAKRTAEAENNRTGYTDEPTYLDPSTYGVYKAYHAVSVAADMEAGYLSNRFSMDAVVEWEPGQSYAYGQLVQYMGYLYLVIKSYGLVNQWYSLIFIGASSIYNMIVIKKARPAGRVFFCLPCLTRKYGPPC